MIKRTFIAFLLGLMIVPQVLADQASDQDYINKLYYRNNKLELATKKRTVNEISSYSNVDINTTRYSYDNYSDRSTNITSNALARSEAKEITEWYIYKGAIAQLSDLEFLDTVGDNDLRDQIAEKESQKAGFRTVGNISIGLGIAGMLGGAAFSASSSTVAGSALVMAVGFFINAFNQTPAHYIRADYAQNKIIEYNLALKKKLNLPLTYE